MVQNSTSQNAARFGQWARRVLIVCCAALAVISTPAHPAFAQDDSSTDGETAPWPNPLKDGVLQTEARLWFQEGEKKPFFFPNTSLGDLLRLTGESGKSSGPSLPNWSFGGIRVDVNAADAEATIADLSVDVQVQTGALESVCEVQLELGSLLLTQWPTMTGESRASIFQTGPSGYEWLIEAAANRKFTINLQGKSRIASDADRRTLNLALPNVPCQIQVHLPAGITDARCRGKDVVISTATSEGTRLDIASSGGEVVLSWQAGNTKQRVAAIEADCTTQMKFRDPEQPWNAESTVDLRWYGADATQPIEIALPPGARLRSLPTVDFALFDIQRRVEGDAEAGSEIVQIVNLDIDQSPTLSLNLQWEWLPALQEPLGDSLVVVMPQLSLNGVDVHHGAVDCSFPAQYGVTVEKHSGVSSIQQSRSTEDPFHPKQLTFEFDEQSFEMQIGIRIEQSLPIVRPTYHVRVEAGKLTLTGWLECSFDANTLTREIGLEMGAWAVQENNARTVTNTDDPLETTGEALQVRRPPNTVGTYFLRAPEFDGSTYGSVGRIEQVWRFVAELEFDADQALEIRIPEIIRDTDAGAQSAEAGSGVLLVSSDDSTLLHNHPGTGLLEDSYSASFDKYIGNPGLRQPRVYRFQTRLNTPYWRGEVEQLSQQITVGHQAEVSVLTSQIAIRQQFVLQVANQDLKGLLYAVRGDADSTQQTLAYVDGNLVSSSKVRTLTQDALEAEFPHLTLDASQLVAPELAATPTQRTTWHVYRLVAPPKLLGRRQIEIESGVGWNAGSTSGDTQIAKIQVPLAKLLLPPQTQQLASSWTLVHGPRIAAQSPLDTADSLASDDAGRVLRPLAFWRSEIPLEVRVDAAGSSAPPRVNKAWLQTVITRQHRRDRFVAQISSAPDELRLTLPKFIDDITVIVDGNSLVDVDYRYDYSTDSLVIKMPRSQRELQTVEVAYFQQQSLAWARRVAMQPPQIEGVAFADVFYWQLLTPASQHLGWCPTTLTPEWQWSWSGLWWHRTSADIDFERQLAASKQAPLARSLNRYVMSGQRIGGASSTWVLSRFALWFPVGSLSILAAYAVLNFAFFRRPIAMLVYGVVVAALATLWPDFSMLLGQTTLIAMGLAGLVWATQVAVDSRVRRRSVFTSRPLSVQESHPGFPQPRVDDPSQPTVRHGGSSVATGGGR